MKKLVHVLLIMILALSCKDAEKEPQKEVSENAFFDTSFENYKELDALKGYEKKIDTSVHIGGWQDTFRLMNLRKNGDFLVLFYKVAEWDSAGIHAASYRPLDTLQINNLQKDERVTVGYCYHEDYYEGEVIAIIKEEDSFYNHIIKAWRANPESEQIELLKDHEGIDCLNEFFESDDATLPLKDYS